MKETKRPKSNEQTEHPTSKRSKPVEKPRTP
jgi:hypothetical protein